ncbi:MAG: GNAT family N-acetyltransferase [Smithella sp.]
MFVILNLQDMPDDAVTPYIFQVLTIDDIKKSSDSNYGFYTTKEVICRLIKGHRLFAYIDNEKNRPAYYSWVEQKNARIDLFRMPLKLPVDMVYHSGEYTRSEYRNQGIASRIKKDIFRYMKNTGIRYILGVIEHDNLIARKISKKIGYKEYQIVNYRRYWQIRHYTIHQCNSDECKSFITLFKAPKDLWKTFL